MPVGRALELDLVGRDRLVELDPVGAHAAPVETLVDRVAAETCAEAVDVVAATAAHPVVAATADKHVVADVAVDARSVVERIIAEAAT